MQDAADAILSDTSQSRVPATNPMKPLQHGRASSFSRALQPVNSRGPRSASFANVLATIDPSEMPEVHRSMSAAMYPELASAATGSDRRGYGKGTAHPLHDLESVAAQRNGRGTQPVSQQWPELHLPVPLGDPSHELYCATRLPLPADPDAFIFTPSLPHGHTPTDNVPRQKRTHAHPRPQRALRPKPAAPQPAAEPGTAPERSVIELAAPVASKKPAGDNSRAAPAPAASQVTRPNPLEAITAQNFTYPQTNPARGLRRPPPPPPQTTVSAFQSQPAVKITLSSRPAGIPSGYLENTFPAPQTSTPSGYRFVAGQGFVCQVCGTAVKRPQRHRFMGRWCEGNKAQMAEDERKAEEDWEEESARRRRIKGPKIVWQAPR